MIQLEGATWEKAVSLAKKQGKGFVTRNVDEKAKECYNCSVWVSFAMNRIIRKTKRVME